MIELPRFTAAAVQAAPVFLDPQATTAKACALVQEAARNGAKLIAFPEAFIPGYPYWNWILTPVEGSAWFEKLWRSSITVPGPEIAALGAEARASGAYVVIGVNERDPLSVGTLYNTLVVLGPDGQLLGRHRKLVPTWAEKLTWTGGDGASLKVYPTELGPLGVLACGENTNTLARFTLLAQGEQVHVASYISLPVAPPDYDMAEAIKLRAAAHCFEGKLFTVVSCSTMSEQIIEALTASRADARALLSRKSSAFSGVIGPDGRVVGTPLIDEEGIVYAEIDLARCIQPTQMHNLTGHYNRFDIFELRVNARAQRPIAWAQSEGLPAPAANASAAGSDRDVQEGEG